MSWHWGVRCPTNKTNMTEPEKERRQQIEAALSRNGLSPADGQHWPNIARPRHQDWSAIVPELVQELADGGGNVTDHYVNGLLQIAEKAIPAIGKVELEDR